MQSFLQIFNKPEEKTVKPKNIRKGITRDEAFNKDFLAWQFSEDKEQILSWINTQYGLYNTLPDEMSDEIVFLNNKSSKGFALSFKKDHKSEKARFLLDYLKAKVLQNNYRSSMSDLRVKHYDNYEECIERHYLKPKHQMLESEKINQEFGNISILLLFKNDIPHQLKFSATAYPDRTFAASKPFDALMDVLEE